MTINLTVPKKTESSELKPRITVIGVGGAGGNAVNNMIQMGLEGVEFVVANSDAQALSHSSADRRIEMGTEVTPIPPLDKQRPRSPWRKYWPTCTTPTWFSSRQGSEVALARVLRQ